MEDLVRLEDGTLDLLSDEKGGLAAEQRSKGGKVRYWEVERLLVICMFRHHHEGIGGAGSWGTKPHQTQAHEQAAQAGRPPQAGGTIPRRWVNPSSTHSNHLRCLVIGKIGKIRHRL
jgi:hypothetical protein